MKDRVAILLPAYNAEATISRAIRSVQAQTYTNWRLYVVNDGSHDNTLSEIIQFDDERITVIDLHPNLGLSGALNRGLDEVQERFVFRMDADDEMDERRMEIQLAHAQRSPGAGIYCAAIRVNGKQTHKPYFNNTQELREILCFANPIAHPTVMFDRDYLPSKLAYEAVTCEDYELWCRLSGLGVRFEQTVEPVLNYFVSDTQKSRVEKNDAMRQAKEIANNYTKKNFPHLLNDLTSVGFFFEDDYHYTAYLKFGVRLLRGKISAGGAAKVALLQRIIKKAIRSVIPRQI